MKHEYEQLELDTRSDLEKALSALTVEAVEEALTLIQRNCDTSADNIMPQIVRNRYEAYGVAAEQTVNVDAATKTIKKDVQELLVALSDPNKSAVEATGIIYNSTVIAAEKLIQAAAIMKRTMSHLYTEECADRPLPLEERAAAQEEDYQETDTPKAELFEENNDTEE